MGSNPAAPVRMEENKTTDILCQNLIVVHWGQCDQMARSIAQNLAIYNKEKWPNSTFLMPKQDHNLSNTN